MPFGFGVVKFMIEKLRVEKFMVEMSGVENFMLEKLVLIGNL